ncbi:MAG: helix-turn-helix domain-containing protein [Prevotellaceae bacterium]|jgi:DNA-binding XRE family transcriptional regulator|nr:helix-turn-helix domain-containing protein [Prevotellaceae bacterium]
MPVKNKIFDVSADLDKEFGLPGTPERKAAEEEAYAFYTGSVLHEARKEAKIIQAELAKRIDSTKSYISRIENGLLSPSLSTFYRIIHALGMKVEIEHIERSTI